MKVVYTSQAWLSIDSCIEFLYWQGLTEEKIGEIIDRVFERAESLKNFPFSGQTEPMLFITTKRLPEIDHQPLQNYILH